MDREESDVSATTNELADQFPHNTSPLDNQVAGHSFNKGCFTIGMLRDEEGHVLKPVNKPELGKREIQFYETVNSSTEKDLILLKQFIPKYFGSVTLTVNGRRAQFLKLCDATKGYKKPCVMDVKIGRQTWEPGAPIKKQQSEEVKYAVCKQQCGFCIPGFQVYDVISGIMEKYGKDYGKKLTKDNIPDIIKKFINYKNEKSKAVGEEMLKQLNKILSWWRTQRIFHIYSSSVLLTYDAELFNTTSDLSFCSVRYLSELSTTPCVQVLLIDFAHVLPANNAIDQNYLNGLEHFVEIFTSVINEL